MKGQHQKNSNKPRRNIFYSKHHIERCRDIIVDSGSLEYAKREATRCIEYAKNSIRKQTIDWNREGVDFLVGLADTLVDRRA